MSNAEADDDERSLVEAIKGSLGKYHLEAYISSNIYPITSYILTNVAAFRLGRRKIALASISEDGVPESRTTKLGIETFEFEDISYILNEFSNSAEMDEHEFAFSLPRKLRDPRPPRGSIYTMNFVLVGTLAAFALTHGIWLLVLRFVCTDSGEEEVTTALKRVEGLFMTLRNKKLEKRETADYDPDFYIYISLLASSVTRRPKDDWESMESLYSLIELMFELVSAAHLFLKDVLEYTPKTMRDEFDSLYILSLYWVARGVFVCSSECNNLPKNGYIIRDSQKLMNIYNKLVSVGERLHRLNNSGKQYMDDQKISSAYSIPYKHGNDNYFALMALLDDPPGERLSHCSNKTMDLSINELRSKTLVLFISDLDVSFNHILILKDIYDEFTSSFQQKSYEFIWLPIHSTPWTVSTEERYAKLLQMMPWYTILDPPSLTNKTRKFITNVWKFQRKPIIVVLNEDGDVVCPNAIHMMYIWRAKAFPFTRMRERTLWKDETSVKSIVLGFDAHITSSLEASKCVILYGGTNTEWLRKFITCVRGISTDSDTTIEMIYLGKNVESDKIHQLISPQYYPSNSKQIWYFWTRLESILIARYQFVNASDDATDPFILQVKRLLSYASAESWTCLITPSSNMMIHDLGDIMLQGFIKYDSWKQYLHTDSFMQVFQNHVEQVRRSLAPDRPCSHIALNIDNKHVVQSLTCPHCNFVMQKRIQYKCCHTDDGFL